MRLLWHSAAPFTNTGYGRCTREIVPRLQDEGHEVAVQCLNSLETEPILWRGEERGLDLDNPIKIYPSSSVFGLGDVEDHFHDFGADFYFTHFDTWMKPARKKIPNMDIPYGSYVIVDHDPVPKALLKQIRDSLATVSMSKWATERLTEKGTRPHYIPHGVDTDTYKPLGESDGWEEPSISIKQKGGSVREVDMSDRFFVGMVAANHGDRKRIPMQMEAFKRLLDEVDEDAILYIHTDRDADNGYNLWEVQEEIGIPPENLIFADSDLYHNIGDEELAQWYNAFDVLINCSQGESWGLTITEAMSCGTPAIVTNFSSMPEQVGAGTPGGQDLIQIGDEVWRASHGVVVNPVTGIWREKVSSKQYITTPDRVFEALRFYHENPDIREDHGRRARYHVKKNYDWENNVLPRFVSLFNKIEEELVEN